MHKRVDAQGFIWFNNLMGELQENHKDVPQMISDWSIRQVVLNKFNDDCHASSKANKAKHEKWEEDHKYSFDYFYENWFLIFESAEKAGVIEDNIKYTKDFVDYSLFPNDFKDDISDYISRIKKLKNEVKSQYREAKKLAKCVDASIFMEDDAGLNSEGKGLLERAQGKAKSTLEAPGKAKNLIPDLDNLSSEVKDLIKINNKDPKDYGYDNDGYESDIENDYNQDQLGSLIKTCDNGASAQATKIKDILAIQMPGLIKKLGGKQNASIDDFVDSLLSSKELQDQILNCINNNGNIVQLYQDICSAIMQNLPNPPGMAFEITEFNEITKRFNKLRKAIRDVIKIVSNKMQEENLGVSISNNSNNYPSDADDEGEHFKEEKKEEKGIGIKEEKKRDKDVEIIKKDVSVTDNYVDTLISQLEGYKDDIISGEKKLSLDKLKDHLERLEACKNEIKADYRVTDKKHLKLPKPKKDEKTKKTTNTKEIKEAKEKIENDMQEKKDKMTKLRAIRAVLEKIMKTNAPEGFFQGHKEPSSDEDFDLHNGMRIPKKIKLKNGKEVKVNFGVSKSDNRSADNQVNEKLVKALTDALSLAGNSVDITEITIPCTTNGQHTDCSNHDVIQDARAFDISGINGKSVVSIKPNDPVIKALQNAFESLPNIRENFGPCYMHKEKEPYGIDNKKLQEQHMDHLHISINP